MLILEETETIPPASFYKDFGPIVIRRLTMEEYFDLMQKMWNKLQNQRKELSL